jgi:hypothetical protein
MAQDDMHEEFFCPTCQALYRVVRVKAEPRKTYRAVHCLVCHATLLPTHQNDILKYFLVRRPAKPPQ